MKTKKPIKDLGKLETKMAVLEEQLQSAVADYRNLEARIEKDVSRFRQESLIRLVDKLVGVLDDLERAEKHLADKGLTMAVNQFKGVLESEGVEEILADKEIFDPVTMDCVDVVAGPKDVVAETVLKGYQLNRDVVRPARVKVGKGK